MELRLLGRVEAWHCGAAVDLGPRQQRFILAVLGLEPKRTVPLDRLIALIWGEDPPRTARNSVQVAVSRLRSVLPDDVALVNTGSGYRLDLEPEQCDAGRFDALLGQARSAPDAQAYELLQQAEALWRGPACGGVTDEETRLRLTHGLQESRLVATEDRMEIALRLGRAGEVLGELTAAVEQHPTRERLVAALMSGLHRTGQTAEALALAARTRELLADELGIDPGRHLQEVQQAILRGELEDSPVAAVPAELPAGVPGFIGRVGALQQLDALLAERVDELPLIAIVGPGGAGKTGLAVQWAHRVAERYTDGQLYADLRGHSTSPTLAPGEVVGRFLRALGVDGSAIPADPAEAAALFRSRTAGRRLLIVLDNAADAGQIRPLLPGSPSCLVVCTSRDRLTGLVGQDGARRLILGRLSRPESLTLLQNVIGGDPDGEDLDLLAERCADLPLALRIAGAILAAAPELAVSDYLEELSGPEALDALEADDTFAVRATFELSYQRLDPAQQRLFRLLGIHPGPDFDAAAAAVIADRPLRETRRLLRRLGAAHLVREEAHGRYTFHDLLGLYSAELAQADPEAVAARRRLFDWYLAMAGAATALLMPGRGTMPEMVDPPKGVFPDRSAAREFLAAEQPGLVAVIHLAAEAGDPVCWQLISVLRLYLRFQSRSAVLSEVAVLTRSAARRAGNRAAEAVTETALADFAESRSDFDSAAAHLKRAAELSRESGWSEGHAGALTNLGAMYFTQGLDAEMTRYCERALELYEDRTHSRGAAANLGNLAVAAYQAGRLDAAEAYFEEALVIHRRLDNRSGQAKQIRGLARIAYVRGDADSAMEGTAHAKELARESGDLLTEAVTVLQLAAIHLGRGDLKDAARVAQAGWDYNPTNDRAAAEALNLIATAEHAAGNLPVAKEKRQSGLDYVRRCSAPYLESALWIGLAADERRLGDLPAARTAAEHALELARRHGFGVREGDARGELAHIDAAGGDLDAARAHAAEAVEKLAATGHLLARRRAEQIRAVVSEL